MQPQRQSTPEPQEQSPELLGSIDAEVEVVLPTLLCQQTPPRPWLQVEVPPLFGESGRPRLVTPAHQAVHLTGYHTLAAPLPSTSVETAQSPAVVQYNVPSPLQEPSLLDLEGLPSSLSWAE